MAIERNETTPALVTTPSEAELYLMQENSVSFEELNEVLDILVAGNAITVATYKALRACVEVAGEY